MDEMLKRILDLMENKHGAQKALAEHLGIHPNVITNWKGGKNKSYRGYVTEIANFYGVSPDYLRLGTSDPCLANRSAKNIDADIKFALFGGDDEITDAQFEEVKRFAAYVKERDKNK